VLVDPKAPRPDFSTDARGSSKKSLFYLPVSQFALIFYSFEKPFLRIFTFFLTQRPHACVAETMRI
jgi:hypothetical protein